MRQPDALWRLSDFLQSPDNSEGLTRDDQGLRWLALGLHLIGDFRPTWMSSAFEELDELGLRRAAADVKHIPSLSELQGAEIARLFEAFLAKEDAGTLEGRRQSGAYFTPPELIDLVVRETLRPILESSRYPDDLLGIHVFDPAVGAGGFLLSAGRILSDRLRALTNYRIDEISARRLVVRHCLFGADVNPLSVVLTTAVLNQFCRDHSAPARVQWADTILPAGSMLSTYRAEPLNLGELLGTPQRYFDAVVGNPPWGAVKPAIREFFASRAPNLLDLQGADLRTRVGSSKEHAQRYTEHADEIKGYARALRESGWYRFQGRGDADLYRYFTERCHQLVRPDGGRLGLVLPAAFLRADGAAPLRRLLLESGSFDLIIEFINSARIFDIHSMFRFLCMSWEAGETRGIDRIHFGIRSIEEAEEIGTKSSMQMSRDFLTAVSGSQLSVPDLRTPSDALLLKQLAGAHPSLGEEGCPWTPRFVRELDMTNDSKDFVLADDPAGVNGMPLYEGRMVHQFDNRAKAYEAGAGRRAVWTTQVVGERLIRPHFRVREDCRVKIGSLFPRAGFCDVTGHANERTILAALIPGDAVAGNKVPTLRFDQSDGIEPHLIWLGIANSFVVDWIARRRVATSLNYFQLAQLPFPRVSPESDIGKTIVTIVTQLSKSVDQWDLQVLQQRAVLRSELDAIVAALFDLDPREFAKVFDDFPLVDRFQPRTLGIAKSTVTRDLAVSTYVAKLGRQMTSLRELDLPPDSGPTDIHERVATAMRSGQIPYVPGEMAKVLFR